MNKQRAITVSAIIGVFTVIAAVVYGCSGPSVKSKTLPPVVESSPTFKSSPDVTWVNWNGTQLPVSKSSGPGLTPSGRAMKFAHDERGAAFAAIWITSLGWYGSGPGVFNPTIVEQFVGSGKPALLRYVQQTYWQVAPMSGVVNGMPIRDSDPATIVGYRVSMSGGLTITLLENIPIDGGGRTYVEAPVSLVWINNDWRVIAPAFGNWAPTLTAINNPEPTAYHTWDEVN